MKKFTLFALATLLSSAVHAVPEIYVIDGNHTLPRFEYNHFGYSTQTSRFDKTSGKITLDRATNEGLIDVVIDTKSVNTGSSLFNEHIQGEDFLDTTKYPVITFKSKNLKFEGDKLVAVDGDLTIKGITKQVTLNVTSLNCKPHPLRKKDACGANASTKIKRSEFNAGKFAPAVSDEITLIIPVEAMKD